MSIYSNILHAVHTGKKGLAVLIDPDKFLIENTKKFIEKVNTSIATHVFVGGSIVANDVTDILVSEIKKHTNLPVVLFPGAMGQITDKADGLLFLSLLSGRNPEYLIGEHVKAVSKLRNTSLDIIATGYVLIESGAKTAVQRVTNTKPMMRNEVENIVHTALAGQFLGMKLIYLEAGSGAKQPVTPEIISAVKKELTIPLIVGGGIKNIKALKAAYKYGADLVVIGTAFEEDELFFDALKVPLI